MSAHQQLAEARDEAMDCRAHNQRQHLLAFNPTVECDSLAEHIVALRRYGVPESEVQRMLVLTRELLVSNTLEGRGEMSLVAQLDDLATKAHAASRRPSVASQPTVKQLAAQIRAAQDDGTIDELVAVTPRSRMLTRSLRGELGVTRSLQLMAALGRDRVPA